MRVLDLCTEFGSETRAFKDRGHEVTTLGIEGNIDIICDIRDFHTDKYYDVMFFCPPCTCFSVASIGKHWKNGIPDKDTLESINIVRSCLRIIKENTPKYWFIENPMGMLRKLPIMQNIPRTTIMLCQYGASNMKPTDIWSNFFLWDQRKCKNGNKDHISAPRGSRTIGSTQGKKIKDRSILPYGLSLELCIAIEKDMNTNKPI